MLLERRASAHSAYCRWPAALPSRRGGAARPFPQAECLLPRPRRTNRRPRQAAPGLPRCRTAPPASSPRCPAGCRSATTAAIRPIPIAACSTGPAVRIRSISDYGRGSGCPDERGGPRGVPHRAHRPGGHRGLVRDATCTAVEAGDGHACRQHHHRRRGTAAVRHWNCASCGTMRPAGRTCAPRPAMRSTAPPACCCGPRASRPWPTAR